MKRRTNSDLALTALAVEAERRRKEKGLLRYSYGNLVADTSPKERQQIIARYRKRHRERCPEAEKHFAETDEMETIRALQDRYHQEEA